MNARIALSSALLAAAFTGSAFAESPILSNDPFVAGASRATVQAELAAFKQAGVNPWSIAYNPLRGFKAAASRDAVRAEFLAARGEVQALTGEDSGSTYLATMRTRAAQPDTLAGQPTRAQ